MKITIPEEHRGHFPSETMWLKLKDADQHCVTKEYSKVFITRWHQGTLLLLNETEYDRLKDNMGLSERDASVGSGFARFISAGIHTAIMTNGEMEIPEHLVSWLEGNDRSITKSENGLLLR